MSSSSQVRFGLLVASLAAMAACGGGKSGPTAPSATIQSVNVSVTNELVFLGSSEQATASATLSNGQTQSPSGAWSSDNSGVATVDGNGRVSGVASGRATIIFSAQGVTGSKSVRVVPRYQGQWSGSYAVRTCDQSGVWASEDFCSTFPINRVFPTNMTLTQGARDVVEGRIFLGTLSTDTFTAPIGVDGFVQPSATIRSGDITVDTLWNMTSTTPGRIVGAFQQTWRTAGLSGEMRVISDIRDLNATSQAASLRLPEANPAPRTLEELLTAMGVRK